MSALYAIVTLLCSWLILVGFFARRLLADWREPVLAAPVLIIESDDWGPGPPIDAMRLRQLADELQTFQDDVGHRPVVTLGLVLAVPGAAASGRANAAPCYLRRTLDDDEFAPVRQAILAGRDAGVFALQLHAMEHFWPPALVRAAEVDSSVRSFLSAEHGVPRHESLPAHLQARWIDASRLPSVSLDRDAIDKAVAEETALFARIFGDSPRVAVPVTFTWTSDVEAAWAKQGVRVVVTPGTRNIGRDGQGRLIGDGSILRNGDATAGGIVHVVRDIYFEPALGHTAQLILPEIGAHHRLGRPALLEMHRFNFTGDAPQVEASFAELRRLLQCAQEIPGLRFLSPETLAAALRANDQALIDRRLAARIRTFVLRAATQPRLKKLAWICGLAFAAALVAGLASALLVRPSLIRRVRG